LKVEGLHFKIQENWLDLKSAVVFISANSHEIVHSEVNVMRLKGTANIGYGTIFRFYFYWFKW
jgi:hypothetical protein